MSPSHLRCYTDVVVRRRTDILIASVSSVTRVQLALKTRGRKVSNVLEDIVDPCTVNCGVGLDGDEAGGKGRKNGDLHDDSQEEDGSLRSLQSLNRVYYIQFSPPSFSQQ